MKIRDVDLKMKPEVKIGKIYELKIPPHDSLEGKYVVVTEIIPCSVTFDKRPTYNFHLLWGEKIIVKHTTEDFFFAWFKEANNSND